MTETARLHVTDSQGERTVSIDRPAFTIGRRATVDLQVVSSDVSREHARITREGDAYLIADCGSRFGTFVNGEAVAAPRALVNGDEIRLGKTDAIHLVFLNGEGSVSALRSASSIADFRQMAAILDGLRALGSGRVLDEVLTLAVDSALDVSGADRGFVMLASESGALDFRLGRAKGRRPLPTGSFIASQKIPREVFETGRTRMVSDLLEGSLAGAHQATVASGIRHVLCVPLRVTRPAAGPDNPAIERIIGVLYLDGRERGQLLNSGTRSSLETFALQAALAIESARLYADAAERVKVERDLRVAADIQRALLPEPRWATDTFDLAATSLPCRTIGGDFFDYLDLPTGDFGFALGDVAGKGPPAALLAAAVQSHFMANAPIAAEPADLMARLNRALLRRVVEARFATMFYGALSPEGRLHYANAGQEPPTVVGADGRVHELNVGGPVLGMLDYATYSFGTATLNPGDIVVVCSDGVTEARAPGAEEFGRARLTATLAGEHGREPELVLERLLAAIRDFAGAEPQADDITALVLRYRGKS